MVKKCFSLAILFLSLFIGYAEADPPVQIDIEASQDTVSAGDIFTVKVTISGKAKISLGDIPEVEHVYIRQAGVMQSSSLVNGVFSSSIVFNFMVQIVKAGEYDIGPFTLNSEGTEYTTDSVTIVVTDNGESADSDDAGEELPPNYYAELKVKKDTVYVGEFIDVTLYFYKRAMLRNFEYNGLDFPTAAWIESLEASENYVGKVERRGLTFEVYEIEKKRLYISQPGIFTIPEAQIKFDGISNTRYQSLFTDSLTVTTESKEIKVLPLPDNPPDGFKGAVGDFSLSSGISRTSMNVKDSTTVEIILEGEGNFHAIDDIGCLYNGAIEEYSSKSSLENKNKTYRVLTWEILLVPNKVGSYSIKTDDFVYFSLKDNQYKTLKGDTYTISVEKTKLDDQAQNIIIKPDEKEDEVSIEDEPGVGNAADIQYIVTRMGSRTPFFTYRSGMSLIMFCYLIFFFLVACFVLVKYFLYRRYLNSAGIRQKGAFKVFLATLSEIALFSEKNTSSYTEIVDKISKALEHYFSQKFEIDSVEFTSRGIKEKFSSILPEEHLHTLKDFIIKLDMIRFGGMAAGQEEVKDIIDQIRDFIKTIDIQKG